MYVTFKNADKMDLSRLEQMDLKCFDICWDRDIWEVMMEHFKVRIAHNGFGAVGFWAAKLSPKTEEDFINIDVVKIAVLPRDRKQGVGRAILEDIKKWVFAEVGRGDDVNIALHVPESMFEPGYETSPIEWLKKNGFTASRPTLVEGPHVLYGKQFKHLYRYTFPRLPSLLGL